jgi:hypothetical protein
MFKRSRCDSTDNLPKPDNRPLTLDQRAAGRTRVAKLLGQLIYKQWSRDQLQPTENCKPSKR